MFKYNNHLGEKTNTIPNKCEQTKIQQSACPCTKIQTVYKIQNGVKTEAQAIGKKTCSSVNKKEYTKPVQNDAVQILRKMEKTLGQKMKGNIK